MSALLRGKKKKPGLILLMTAFSTFLLMLSTLLTVLASWLIVEPYYMKTLRQRLEQTKDLMIATQFEPIFVRALQTDIRIFVVDQETGAVTYIDSYFHGEKLPDAVSLATPPGEDAYTAGASEAEPEYRAARLLRRAVDYTLDGQDGFYFAADNWGRETDTFPLKTKAIYLNGLSDGTYYSLCLTVESVNASLKLATRASIIVSLSVWLLGMLLIAIFYRRLTSTSNAVIQAAQQLAKLDFSTRCPPAISREYDELAQHVNTLSDQLEVYLEQLHQTNQRLSEELRETARQHRLTHDLIDNLSHDLKTPVAIISGYAEGLTEGVAKTEAQRKRYAEMILLESEHMQGVISKMLALSRLEAEQFTLSYSDFDLSAMVEELTGFFQREMEQDEIEAELTLEKPLQVHSDYNCIRQVVINYIQNAVHHINEGNQIRIVTERVGEEAEFRIANSSARIDDEMARSLWDKLYRGSNARSRDHGESGLGLSIVRGNMEQLGQPYGFRNLEEEHMVEFYIRLPLV